MSQLNNPFVIIFTSPPEHQGCAAAFWFHVMREQMHLFHRGCPGGSVKQSACQCRRLRFSPWAGKIPWRRKRQSTPVLLSGKSHGQRSLVGCSPWACKELNVTQLLNSNNSSVFHSQVYVTCSFLQMLLIQLKKFHSVSLFSEGYFFSHEWVKNFVKYYFFFLPQLR